MSGASCTGSNQATNQQRNEANGSVTRRCTAEMAGGGYQTPAASCR